MSEDKMRAQQAAGLRAVEEIISAPLGRKIYAAIPKIMAEVGAVAKSRKNPQQGYNFRGIDEVYQATQLVLAKHGVSVVPFIVEREREERATQKGGAMFSVRLLVDHRFYADDGSFVVARTLGEAMDSGDKASNKAMSAAMKYALLEVFCIPTAEPKDTEDDSPEVAAKDPADAPAADLTPIEVNRVREAVEKVLPKGTPGDRAKYVIWAVGHQVESYAKLTRPEAAKVIEKANAGEVPA